MNIANKSNHKFKTERDVDEKTFDPHLVNFY